MNKSESIRNIGIALSKFQEMVGKIRKSAVNPVTQSSYAPLDAIQEAIREPLLRCELTVVQLPQGKNELSTMIVHSSGEWIESTYEMTPRSNDPQGIGSNITYQRRYALAAALNLCLDDDDDGNKAVKKEKKSVETKKREMKKAGKTKAEML